MSPEVGARVIAEARANIGSHYIHGAYGATPNEPLGFLAQANNTGTIVPRRAGS